MRKALYLALAISCLGIVASNAASKNTANYIRSEISKFDGTLATVDVVAVTRINLDIPDHKDIALFAVHTVDDKNMTNGGTLLAIVNASEASILVNRYGTSVGRSGGKVRSKTMSGTIGRIRHEGKEDIVFINISAMKNPETLPLSHRDVLTTSNSDER